MFSLFDCNLPPFGVFLPTIIISPSNTASSMCKNMFDESWAPEGLFQREEEGGNPVLALLDLLPCPCILLVLATVCKLAPTLAARLLFVPNTTKLPPTTVPPANVPVTSTMLSFLFNLGASWSDVACLANDARNDRMDEPLGVCGEVSPARSAPGTPEFAESYGRDDVANKTGSLLIRSGRTKSGELGNLGKSNCTSFSALALLLLLPLTLDMTDIGLLKLGLVLGLGLGLDLGLGLGLGKGLEFPEEGPYM